MNFEEMTGAESRVGEAGWNQTDQPMEKVMFLRCPAPAFQMGELMEAGKEPWVWPVGTGRRILAVLR